MKKILLILFSITTSVFGAPFLVCDQQIAANDQAVSYTIAITGTAAVNATSPAITGVYGFKYDLAALAAGTYTAVVNGVDASGFAGLTSTVTFTLPVAGPPAPVNPHLVPQ